MGLWRRLILIILIVVTSALIMLPTTSRMLTDYGNPVEAKWGDGGEMVIEFERPRPDFMSWLWLIIPLVIVLGLLFFFVGDHWCDRYAEDQGNWLGGAISFQALLLVCLGVGAPLINEYYYEVSGRIGTFVEDETLAERALDKYREVQYWFWAYISISLLSANIMLVLIFSLLSVGLDNLKDGYQSHTKRLAEELRADTRPLMLCPDGTVRGYKYRYRFRLWPFPAAIPERVETGAVPLLDLCKVLNERVPRQALDQVCRSFKTTFGDLFTTVKGQATTRLTEAVLSSVREQVNGKHAELVARSDDPNFSQAQNLLQTVSGLVLSRFKQSLLGGVEDAVKGHLGEFRRHALAFMQLRESSETINVPYDGAAFPRGTKFCLSKGDTTVFVIEEAPQVRTITFAEGFEAAPNQPLDGDYEYRLSFPYVVFVIATVKGGFDRMCAFYNYKPLRSLDEELYWCNLPNIGLEGYICLEFNGSGTRNAATEAEAAISHFWHSSFSDDYHRHYVSSSNPLKVDDWATETEVDPSIALIVNWEKRRGSLEELVTSLLRLGERQELHLAEQKVRHSFNQAVNSLVGVVRGACDGVPTKGRFKKAISGKLSSHLDAVGKSVLSTIETEFKASVIAKGDNAGNHYEYHLQREVNQAVVQTLLPEVVAALSQSQGWMERFLEKLTVTEDSE